MLTALTTGLVTGAIYALVALGYNITYVAAGVLNFAYANFIVLGAFIAVWLGGENAVPVVVVLLAAALIALVIGVLEEEIAIRPLKPGGHGELVTTVGVSTVLTGFMIIIWGSEPLRVPSPVPAVEFRVAGTRFDLVGILIVVSAVVLAVAIHVALRKTRWGLATLAQSEDRDAARLLGVNVRSLAIGSFALAAAVGGLMGPLVGVKTFAITSVPLLLAIKGFVAMTLGGVGSHLGALVGGLSIGVLESLSARYIGGEYQNVAVFLVFIAILMLRPQGLFGQRTLRTV